MPTVYIECDDKRIDANEYSLVTGMYLLIEEAMHQFANQKEHDAVPRLKSWWIARTSVAQLFVLNIKGMLQEVDMSVEMFQQCLVYARTKAITFGEWLEPDYLNALVAPINWKPNRCRVSALLEAFEQLTAAIR